MPRRRGSASLLTSSLAQLGLIRTLRGLTPKFGSFDDEQFDELQFERHLASNPAFGAAGILVLALERCKPASLPADYASAVDASLRAQQLLWTSPSQLRNSRVSLLWRAFARGILGFRISRPETAAFRGSDGSPQAARNMGGALPGEFRKPRRAGRRGDRTHRRPRARCRAALRTGHPLGARKRLCPQ